MCRRGTICVLHLVCVLFATAAVVAGDADLWPVDPLVRPSTPEGHPIDAFLDRVLEIGRRHGMVHRRIASNHDNDVGILAGIKRRADGARIDVFHQGGDA